MATMIDIWWNTWIPVAGISLGFATILVSLIYMLGSALMNDRMKTWAKLELFEVFYSAIIIAIIATPSIGALAVVDSAMHGALFGAGPGPTVYSPELDRPVSLCGDGSGDPTKDPLASQDESIYHNIPSCHIRLGIYYLHTIFKETSDLAFKTYVSYTFTSMAADFAINFEFITEMPGFFTFTPWRGFFTMGNTIKSMVFDYAIKIMMITKFQEVFLAFMAKAAFPGLFVIGVVLRTFTFTRKLGGLLMGIGIALYYIFPAFYAFGGLVMLDMKKQLRDPASEFQKSICKDLAPDDRACKDPPLTNAIYIKGEIPMIGGNIDTNEMQEAYIKAGKETASKRADDMETGATSPIKDLDLSSHLNNPDKDTPATEEARKKEHAEAKKSVDTFFTAVSKQSKFDVWVLQAFHEGGPIDALSRLAFFSVFFSLFGILGTIAAIRSLSVTFGGDIEIAGLTHLI